MYNWEMSISTTCQTKRRCYSDFRGLHQYKVCVYVVGPWNGLRVYMPPLEQSGQFTYFFNNIA